VSLVVITNALLIIFHSCLALAGVLLCFSIINKYALVTLSNLLTVRMKYIFFQLDFNIVGTGASQCGTVDLERTSCSWILLPT
jgi:hypothetical protein